MNKTLPVVWHNQRNNTRVPTGTCNATSIATVMQWLGINPFDHDPSEQLDDYVTRQLDTPEAHAVHQRTLINWRDYNPRNNHYVIRWYLGKIGIKDTIVYEFDPDMVKQSIDRDMPVICGGSYARKKQNGIIGMIGHINTIVGYSDTGFIFNDSYGNANTMYQDASGDHVEYKDNITKGRNGLGISIMHILEKV